MAKNKYPDSLSLEDCRDFNHLYMKLRDFYCIESYNPSDVIIEVLMQQYGIVRSEKHSSAVLRLFKCVAQNHVRDISRLTTKQGKGRHKFITSTSYKNYRQGLIISMFELLMSKGISQNRAAQILTNKGMSKGVKRRYHEAKKNGAAIKFASVKSAEASSLRSNGIEKRGSLDDELYTKLEYLMNEFAKMK